MAIGLAGPLQFLYAVVIGVRDGIVRKQIRRGSNHRLLVGDAAVRYGWFCVIAGLTLAAALVMIAVLSFVQKHA